MSRFDPLVRAAKRVNDHWNADKDLDDEQQQNLVDLGDLAGRILDLVGDHADLELALQEKGKLALHFHNLYHSARNEVDALSSKVIGLQFELGQSEAREMDLRKNSQ